MKKKTLHLNLKKKWFDMILSGEKKEEYREIKTHYLSRLVDFKTMHHHKKQGVFEESYCYPEDLPDLVSYYFKRNEIQGNSFDTVTFSNGYAKDRPQFEIEFKGIEIREGSPEWGAICGIKYFVIKLGKIKNKQS